MVISVVRSQIRPLWRLKKWSVYRNFQTNFDATIFSKLPGLNFKVAVKLLRDLPWWLSSWGVATNIESMSVKQTLTRVFEVVNPSVFWDVGGNVGYYSWIALSLNPDVEVVLFEPDKTNIELIKKTISKNNLKTAEIIEAAVSEEDGILEFLTDPISGATGCINSVSQLDNMTSLHHDFGLNKVVSVKSISLDSLVKTSRPPDVVKIDVEGAEHLVISGAKQMIQTYKPVVVMETTNNEMIDWFESVGYRVERIDNGNILCISPIYIGRLSCHQNGSSN
jgi:FkbM family methyltransferase